MSSSAQPTKEMPSSSRFRPLLPATSSSPNAALVSPAASSDVAPLARRTNAPIPAACGQCRKAKTKCSGARPTCHRCASRDLECVYDVDPGVTRTEALRRQAEAATYEIDEYQELLNSLRSRAWEEAVEILRHIRRYETVTEVNQIVRDSDILLQTALGLEVATANSVSDRCASADESRLPPTTADDAANSPKDEHMAS